MCPRFCTRLEFTGDRREDLFENTRRWSERYEKLIRMYPDQWGWNHNRLNTKPSDLPEGFLRYATLPREAMARAAGGKSDDDPSEL